MALKTILGALAITGAVMTCAGCPDNKGGAGTGGSTATGTMGSTATGTAASTAEAAGSTASSAAGSTAAAAGAMTMSDDDKHKLYQAASMTGDPNMVSMVSKKIGIWKEDGMPTEAAAKFNAEHSTWATSNVPFMQSLNSPEKAKEYVNSHVK